MSAIRRLLVTYDFVSTAASRGIYGQLKKLDWVVNVLSQLNIDVTVGISEFSKQHLYYLCGVTVSDSVYQSLTFKDATPAALEYIEQHLNQYDLVIGYELSRESRVWLDKLNIPYIDMWLSPVRFHNDIMFEMYANISSIQQKIQRYRIEERTLLDRVSELRVHAQKFLPTLVVPHNTLLLVGQVNEDKSILCNGQFLTLPDFAEDIVKFAQSFDHVLLLKHPKLSERDFAPIVTVLADYIEFEILEGANSYQLMLQEEITGVAGISSSLISEAKYFGKQTKYFYKPVIDTEYVRVFDHYLCASFWVDLFDMDRDDDFRVLRQDNFLREKYGLEYAFAPFMPSKSQVSARLADKYSTVVDIYHVIENLDKSKRYVLYGFGSVGRLIFPHIKSCLCGIIDQSAGDIDQAGLDIAFISINELLAMPDVTVIVTPFLYNRDIRQKLSDFSGEVIWLEAH